MEHERHHVPLIFAVAGMQACWLYTALLLTAVKSGSDDLSPALTLSIFPVSWAFTRGLKKRPWPWLAKACAGIAAWSVFTFLLGQWLFRAGYFSGTWLAAFASRLIDLPAFPNGEQLFFLSSCLLWWLGKRLAGLRPTYPALVSEFQFGMAMLLILFFMASQWRLDLQGLILVCLTFFAFSSVGIALAHAEEGKGWLYTAQRNQWLSILVFAVCLAFALGLLMSAAVKPELLKALLALPKFLWNAIAELLRMIVAFLASLLPKTDPVWIPPPGGPPAIPGEPPEWVQILRIPEWVRRVGQIVVSSLWLILILAALWSLTSQIIHWLRLRLDHDGGASYEPIPGAFREDLKHLFRLILDRLSALIRRFRRDGRSSETKQAESVRHIYRQLLEWAASAGCPRHVAQTPGEYLLVLNERFPGASPEFRLLTEHYTVARYSPFQPTKDVLAQSVTAWNRVKRIGKQARPPNS